MSHDATSRRLFGVTLETVVRRILSSFDRATPGILEEGARWYDEAGLVAADLSAESHLDVETCAAVIAHLSPRTPWSRNILGARALLVDGTRGNGIIGANFERALEALSADEPLETLNGPKTRRFALNILGDREAVTVDVWAARVAGVDEELLGRKGAYDALEHAYRLAARRRGVDPATMQATTWIVARNGRAS